MYHYCRQIFLRETDATGVLLFSEQLNLALEALEAFFLSRDFSLQEMLNRGKYTIPIVHAEAHFWAPIHVCDRVAIDLSLEKRGESSFTVEGAVRLSADALVGKTRITHVCVLKQSGKSTPLPPLLLGHLAEL